MNASSDRFDSDTNLAKYITSHHKLGFVAHTGQGELSGFILYCMGYVWSLDQKRFHQSDDTGFISDIIVHPGFWRQGIGTTLVRRAEDDLAKMGARKVTLFTGPDNTRAQAFFTRLGYWVSGKADSIGFKQNLPSTSP
jgi:ribosomal protein S18 acetylase RimI-like enzyme